MKRCTVWLAVDSCKLLGSHTALLFRHEPYLTEAGLWYCKETDEELGGRNVVPNLLCLEPGQMVKAEVVQ